MNIFRFDLFVLGMVVAGLAIAIVFGYMIMVPRNDDEELEHKAHEKEQTTKR